MRTEVYSWRVAPDLKSGLEAEARRRNLSVSAVLDQAAHDWLRQNASDPGDQDEQERLHQAALECIGAFAGSDPHRAERSGELVRKRLRRKHDR